MPTPTAAPAMRAARVHAFGPPEAITIERLPIPTPGEGEVLVRVAAAGVGPWDAWIRAGKSVLPQPLPLTLGSDVSGTVEAVGPGVTGLRPGEAVYGATNPNFTGAYADHALAEAAMVARKPATLDHLHAASVPVIAVTAWQMLFDHARLAAGQRVLIHGGAGNVGAYAVQLASQAGAEVIATASAGDLDRVRELGAQEVIDFRAIPFETVARDVDAVIDLVGGETLNRSFAVLKPGGVLVSAVAEPDQARATEHGVRALFMLVSVTAVALTEIARLIDAGRLRTQVGEVLPLEQAVLAHRMLGGAPHKPGKIVLRVATLRQDDLRHTGGGR
jgi:NADPH:quinone reductase-like Zn-dependent oxidoreductase